MTARSDCTKKHLPLWGAIATIATLTITVIVAAAAGGFSLHGKAERHDAEIDGVQDGLQRVERKLDAVEGMVRDLWRKNGGHD